MTIPVRASEIVAALPTPLAPLTVYYIERAGSVGYDVVATDADALPIAMNLVLVKGDPGGADTVAACEAARDEAEAAQATATTKAQTATDQAGIASTGASTATTKAQVATDQATASENAATAAAAFAMAAAGSKDAAVVSEGKAATSAAQALSSKNSAASSEANAATSVTAAASSATSALNSANQASATGIVIVQNLVSAQSAATAAANSATAAATSATGAATSKTGADTSATNAANSATAAAGSATAASTQATSAANSATAAAASAAAALANQLPADWAVSTGVQRIVNKPTTLAGYGITDALASASKGAANGVAPLDATSRVPAAYLPAYVDDVLEFNALASFPVPGEAGKIYIALDTGKIYRWSGSAYVEISASPGSTDAVTEGAVNLYHTNARVTGLIAASLGVSVQAYSAVLAGWAGIAQIDGSNNVGIGMAPTGSFKIEISGSLKVSTALVAGSWTMNSTTGVYLSAGSRGKLHAGALAAGGAYPLGISSGDGVTMTGGHLFFNVDGVEQLRLTSTEARFRGPISTPNVNSSSQSNFQGNQQGGIYQAATVGYGTGGLMVQGLGVGAAAYMSFHRPGAFAMCLGLDVNNKLACGGWSMGLNSYEIYHAGNPPPNQIMAHGRVNGSTGALLRSVGVTSCTRLAAGTYEIVLAGTLPANVEVFVTTARTASNVQIGFEDDTFRSGNTIRIFTVNNAHNAEDAKFSFAII